MKGCKVFEPDWTRRGFQYEVGKTYEIIRPSEDEDDDKDEEIYDGEYGADDFDDDEAVEDAAISAALDGEDSDDEQ